MKKFFYLVLFLLVACKEQALKDYYGSQQKRVYDSFMKYHALAMKQVTTDSFEYYHYISMGYSGQVMAYTDSFFNCCK